MRVRFAILSSESGSNWTAEEWEIPLNLMVSHIYHLGNQPVSLEVGALVSANPAFRSELGFARHSHLPVPKRGLITGSPCASVLG